MTKEIIETMLEEMRISLVEAMPKITESAARGCGADIKFGLKIDQDNTGRILITKLSFTVEKYNQSRVKSIDQIQLF